MSRVAERRALPNHWPRTALTIIVVIMPRMTNTIIISMNVKPATRQRRENERLSTDASSLRLGTCDVLSTGKAHAERASLRTGTPFTSWTASISGTCGNMQQPHMVYRLCTIEFICYIISRCNIRNSSPVSPFDAPRHSPVSCVTPSPCVVPILRVSLILADSWYVTLQLAVAFPRQMRRGPVDEECPTALRAMGFDRRVDQRRAMSAMGADAVGLAPPGRGSGQIAGPLDDRPPVGADAGEFQVLTEDGRGL